MSADNLLPPTGVTPVINTTENTGQTLQEPRVSVVPSGDVQNIPVQIGESGQVVTPTTTEPVVQEGATILSEPATAASTEYLDMLADDKSTGVAPDDVESSTEIQAETVVEPAPEEDGRLDKETAVDRYSAEHDDRAAAIDHEDLADRVDSFVQSTPNADGSIPETGQAVQDHLTGNPVYDTLPGKQVGFSEESPSSPFDSKASLETQVSGSDDEKDKTSSLIRGEADRLSESADKKGDWAEILSKNAPSEDYLRDHDLTSVSAESLAALDDECDSHLRTAEEYETRLDKLVAEYSDRDKKVEFGRSNYYPSFLSILEDEMYEVCSYLDDHESYEKFTELAGRDTTTISELKAAYSDVCRAVAEEIRHDVELHSVVLKDVKSGRAASYTSAQAA